LLYWYKSTNTACFTGTKVQILTQLEERRRLHGAHFQVCCQPRVESQVPGWLVQK
jgi:hypothetical protein